MAITDLTGTKWHLNNNVDLVTVSYSLDFVSNGKTYTLINIGCGNALVYSNSSLSVKDIVYVPTSWADVGYRTVTVLGGTHAKNQNLISWLQANAVQISIVNKVIYGNTTVMDITDTTATEDDVAEGVIFYKADGTRSVGTMATSGLPEITIKGEVDNPTISPSGSIYSSNIHYALSADKKFGMLYGSMVVKGVGGTSTREYVHTGVYVEPIPSERKIFYGAVSGYINPTSQSHINYITIEDDGELCISFKASANNTNFNFNTGFVRWEDLY